MPLTFQNLVKKVARLNGFKAECVFHRCYMKHSGRVLVVLRWIDGHVLIDAPLLDDETAQAIADPFSAMFPTELHRFSTVRDSSGSDSKCLTA